jgi:hypothetical protein
MSSTPPGRPRAPDLDGLPVVTFGTVVTGVGLGLGALAGIGVPGVVVLLIVLGAGNFPYRGYHSAQHARRTWNWLTSQGTVTW